MAEYGSGVRMMEALAFDKERIKEAMNGRLMIGEDDQGFIYDDCSKEEAQNYILDAYDNLVFQLVNANSANKAYSRVIKDANLRIDYSRFFIYLEQERMEALVYGKYHFGNYEKDTNKNREEKEMEDE